VRLSTLLPICTALTHICRIAHVTGTEARDLTIQLGDAHVYRDHANALRTQLERKPKPFPTVRFARDVTSMDDFVFEDVIVEGYESWPAIKMDMSV
jgi:thymidylate synthase